jgi:hypothetical protein
MGRFRKSGQVRRPATDTEGFAARGEREADQESFIGPVSESPAAKQKLTAWREGFIYW